MQVVYHAQYCSVLYCMYYTSLNHLLFAGFAVRLDAMGVFEPILFDEFHKLSSVYEFLESDIVEPDQFTPVISNLLRRPCFDDTVFRE